MCVFNIYIIGSQPACPVAKERHHRQEIGKYQRVLNWLGFDLKFCERCLFLRFMVLSVLLKIVALLSPIPYVTVGTP